MSITLINTEEEQDSVGLGGRKCLVHVFTEAVITVSGDAELSEQLRRLVSSAELRETIGRRAGNAIRLHRGAIDRTISMIEELEA